MMKKRLRVVDAGLKWVDATSYSRGQKRGADPRTWRANVGGFRVVVTRYMDDPETWFLRWDVDDLYDLETDDVEDAKWRAAQRIKAVLEEALGYLS